jgi:hypothetical protein
LSNILKTQYNKQKEILRATAHHTGKFCHQHLIPAANPWLCLFQLLIRIYTQLELTGSSPTFSKHYTNAKYKSRFIQQPTEILTCLFKIVQINSNEQVQILQPNGYNTQHGL